MNTKPKTTRTARLLRSFADVEILPMHRNYDDQGPWLRDFGIPAVIAAKLIRFGEQNELVCTFENARGVSDRRHCWQSSFLRAAVKKHLEIFGDAGRSDLTEDLLAWAAQGEGGEHEQPSQDR